MIDIKNKRVLVTGGTGFFGQHIVKAFERHGCLDVNACNSMFDLRRFDRVYSLLNQFNPEIIVHCAAHCGGIGLNKERPAELFYDNIMMGATLMDAAQRKALRSSSNSEPCVSIRSSRRCHSVKTTCGKATRKKPTLLTA